MKKCSECINGEMVELNNVFQEKYILCHQANEKVKNEFMAKDCKCYEESRITIVCSPEDKNRILEIFEFNCPFSPYVESCGEESICMNCLEENIRFNITE
ncbi:hypothetical protein [Clostridium sp.]|uniref:hypothetical protein n=1 Tax=Clostridium sp. TaxID=1506 RepID=UPI0026107592|nr:hypothetical protein [Clostridium sp.]